MPNPAATPLTSFVRHPPERRPSVRVSEAGPAAGRTCADGTRGARAGPPPHGPVALVGVPCSSGANSSPNANRTDPQEQKSTFLRAAGQIAAPPPAPGATRRGLRALTRVSRRGRGLVRRGHTDRGPEGRTGQQVSKPAHSDTPPHGSPSAARGALHAADSARTRQAQRDLDQVCALCPRFSGSHPKACKQSPGPPHPRHPYVTARGASPTLPGMPLPPGLCTRCPLCRELHVPLSRTPFKRALLCHLPTCPLIPLMKLHTHTSTPSA